MIIMPGKEQGQLYLTTALCAHQNDKQRSWDAKACMCCMQMGDAEPSYLLKDAQNTMWLRSLGACQDTAAYTH